MLRSKSSYRLFIVFASNKSVGQVGAKWESSVKRLYFPQIKDLQARVELLSGDRDERQEAISLLVKNLLTEK